MQHGKTRHHWIAVTARSLVTAVCLMAPLAVTGTATAANAESPAPAVEQNTEVPLEEDLPLPDEPEEVDMGEDRRATGLQCKTGWYFDITKNKKNTMSVKYHTFVKNDKNYQIDFKFTSKKSGTTEVGASVTVSAEFKTPLLSQIKAEVQANAKKSWTSEIGIETYGKVKAHDTVYGDYGIMKENVYGYRYYRGSACQKSNKTHMTAWAPYREGWVIK